MKKFILVVCLLGSILQSEAQFRRSSDSNAYPYSATLSANYVFLLGRPGVTNYNFAASNLLTIITNISAGEAYLATNNFLITATNIAAYQAYLATNNTLGTITNISAYQAFLATNNYGSTATNISNYAASNAAYLSTNGYGSTVTSIINATITIAYINSNITNISGQNVRYPTNQGSTVSIDVGNKYTGLSTNNNMTIAGCANIDSSGTNVSWGILTVTNSAGSGAVKTIDIPAGWVDVDNLGGSTIYNTNQGILSVMVYPGLGTNFIWRGK